MFQELAGCAIMMSLVVVFSSLSRMSQLIDALCDRIRSGSAVSEDGEPADDGEPVGDEENETVEVPAEDDRARNNKADVAQRRSIRAAG